MLALASVRAGSSLRGLHSVVQNDCAVATVQRARMAVHATTVQLARSCACVALCRPRRYLLHEELDQQLQCIMREQESFFEHGDADKHGLVECTVRYDNWLSLWYDQYVERDTRRCRKLQRAVPADDGGCCCTGRLASEDSAHSRSALTVNAAGARLFIRSARSRCSHVV